MSPHRRGVFAAAALIALAATVRVAADGTTLVVAKRAVLGIVNAPPAGEGEEYAVTGVTFSNGLGTFDVQTYRDPATNQEQLQFLFTILDGSPNNGDKLVIRFDFDHDHAVDPSDRAVVVSRQAGPNNVRVGGLNLFGDPSSPVDLPDAQWEVSSAAAQWTAEVKLTAADLGLTLIPDLIGMHIQVSNVPNAGATVFGNYPNAITPNTIASWSNVKTRHPIDYIVVLDRSGSMLSQQKWQNAKAATNIFANIMSMLGDQANFEDRIGLVSFSWLCSGGNQTVHKNPGTPLAPVPLFPVGNYTDSPPAVTDPLSSFCTPIGEGLELAFSALDATTPTATAARQRAVLLLSDGLQNRPNDSFLPGDTGYDPCGAPAWQPCTQSNVPVSTIAFGEGDWQVDTDLLNDVRGRYAGAAYNFTDNNDDLKEAFISGLEDLYATNSIYSGLLPASFPVDPGNRKVIAVASWNAGGVENIKLQRDGGGGFVDVPCDPAAASDATVGMAICAATTPQSGTWRVQAADGAFAVNPSRLFVIADLQLRGRFATTPVQPLTSDPLLITAELTSLGLPSLNTSQHPVSVNVVIERPDEGVGTFATLHEPNACAIVRPTLPPIRGSTIRAQSASNPTSPDPSPPLYSLMTHLLGVCSLTGLPRSGETLELRDDGTQGDAVAGDGIYSRRYTGTPIEGTYVMRFNVDGRTAEGHRFTRTKRQATYVRVKVDARASDIGSRILSQVGTVIVREYYILPVSAGGQYLGPGRRHKVNFALSGPGTFVSSVIDYGNGYYSQRVRYDVAHGEPVVTPEVNGQPLPAARRRFEAGLFASLTGFSSALELDTGLGVGGRFGYRLSDALVAEAELDLTATEVPSGSSARAVTLFGSLRADLGSGMSMGGATLVPFATAGMGTIWLRESDNDEQAAAFQMGAGANLWFRRDVAVRADVRLLRFGNLRGAGATTSSRMTLGVVVRF